MQSLISTKHKKLVSDIVHLAREKVKQRGKQLSSLRFAKRTMNGYAFFEVGHRLWEDLHEIADKAFQKNPDNDFSFVVEVCSELVNMDESDLSSLDLAA